MQHMVQTSIRVCALQREYVERLLNNADPLRIATRISADVAGVVLGEG